MSTNKWIVPLLGSVAMAASSVALAQRTAAADTGWYVGAAVGQNDDLDDEMAWKFTAGYQVNRNVSAEFSYSMLGERSPGFGVSAEASAFELVGLYKFPVASQISLYGLLGLARIESEVTAPAPVGTRKDNSTELTLGFGAQYDVSRNLGIRAQYQDYDSSGVISVGVVYKF